MSSILLPGRRNGQPASIVRLPDGGWVWIGSAEGVTAKGATAITGTRRYPSPVGVGRGLGASLGIGSSDKIVLAEKETSTAVTWVFQFLVNGGGGGGYGRLMQKGSSISGEEAIWYDVGYQRPIYQRYNTAGTRLCDVYIAEAGLMNGAFHTLVISQDGTVSAPIVLLDGVQQTTSAYGSSAGNAANNTDAFVLGNRPDGARGWDGVIALAARLPRANYSLEELRRISLNPWSILQPDSRRMFVAGVASTGNTSLAIDDVSVASSSDNATLEVGLALATQDATLATTSDYLGLWTDTTLQAQDMSLASAFDNVTLGVTGETALAIADASLTSSADAATLTVGSVLAIQDALSALTADSPTLAYDLLLAIQDAAIAASADGQVLVVGSVLSANDASLALAVDGVVVWTGTSLSVQDAAIASSADNVALDASGQANLTIQDAAAATSAGALDLVVGVVLQVDDATMAVVSDSLVITPVTPATDSEKIALILKILSNRQELDPATGTFRLYDDNGVTVLYEVGAWEDAAGTIPYRGRGLQKLDRLV